MNVHVAQPTSFPQTGALALRQEGVEFTLDLLSGLFDYGKLFTRLWEEGETFILMEHDIAPPPGVIEKMWNCERDFCVSPYVQSPGSLPDASLGLCKFSKKLLRRCAGAPSAGNLAWSFTAWWGVDGAVYDALERFDVYLRPSVRPRPNERIAHWHRPSAHCRVPH